MAGAASLKLIGDWNAKVGVGLRDALSVSMDVAGRTGEQACQHALILMAQSARALTVTAKKNRQVLLDARLHGAKYVENWVKGKTEPQRLYKFQFDGAANARDAIPGTWENARKIGNAGLAKRSWMWGLAKLKPMHTGKAIPGASRVFAVTSEKVNGYIKENRLDYILKAMPSGWEASVAQAATNKIMAQARMRLERQWEREARRQRKVVARSIQSFFLQGVA